MIDDPGDGDDAGKQLDEERLRQLGNTVRAERARRNLTQPQLAELMGVSKNTIVAIEAGRVDTSFLTVWHIADALGLHIRDLLE